MLKIRHFEAGYGKALVLSDINLNVSPGEIHGLLGMNGAGKTTLFKALCRLGPACSGTITWQGRPLNPASVGYLPATPYFYPYQTGWEYLELCRHKNRGFPIGKWNGLFRLPLDQLTETYSTGMRKKLALLGVLAGPYQILLLDEPFSGLDFESTEVLHEVLEELKGSNFGMLMSSHILATMQRVCEQISYLSEGQIRKTFCKNDFPALESMIRSTIKDRTKAAWSEIRKPL